MLNKQTAEKIALSVIKKVRDLDLCLQGKHVITECASGYYAATPVIALAAGAEKVTAFGRDSSYGTYKESAKDVSMILAALGSDKKNILFTNDGSVLMDELKYADIVTNSGHLRPIDKKKISEMRPGTCVPLMYELWEYRHSDVDIKMCLKKGINVVGTNERHPRLGIFGYLGFLAVKKMFERGLEVFGNRVYLISDNDFAGYIEGTLKKMGADVSSYPKPAKGVYDAVIFAHTPVLCGGTLKINYDIIPEKASLCLQIWGDVNRRKIKADWIPDEEPERGHMGLNISVLGPEPVVRLMAGSLKASEAALNKKRMYKNIEIAQYTGAK